MWHVRCGHAAQAGADGGLSRVGEEVTVRAWVRTVRAQKAFAFVEVRAATRERSGRE